METVTIRIAGMKDEQCLRAVANAIQDLPHIAYLDISLEKAEAEVGHGALISSGDILQAIEDAGYTASL
jgi:copper chaperone CopZ